MLRLLQPLCRGLGDSGSKSSSRRLLHPLCRGLGDWSAQAAAYAANRGGFQSAYAHDCWSRVTSRTKIADVVRRATRVLDVGCGSGEFTKEIVTKIPSVTTVVGVDISEDMIGHARRLAVAPATTYVTADLATAPRAVSGTFDLATSSMVLHWPGPDPALLSSIFGLLAPGGAFVAGLHGAGSCPEAVDAIEAAAVQQRGWNVELDALSTMFKRDTSATWRRALATAGFVDVDVRELEIQTFYATPAEAATRLKAAWPPILAPHAKDIPALMDAAGQALVDAHPGAGAGAVLTSRVLEFSAHRPTGAP